MKRAIALAAVLLLLPSVASAKRPPKHAPAAAEVAPTAGPSPAAKAAAKQHFATAEGLFRDSKFAEAIAEYQAAYDAWNLDAFFFNIGQCHRNLGHVDEAISNFEKYLNSPTVKNRAEVEAVLVELRAKKAATQVAATGPATPAEAPATTAPAAASTSAVTEKPTEAPKAEEAPAVAPPSTSDEKKLATEKKSEAPAAALSASPTKSGTEPTPIYKKGWFWGAVVGAIVVVGGGVAAASLGSPHLPSGSLGTGDWR